MVNIAVLKPSVEEKDGVVTLRSGIKVYKAQGDVISEEGKMELETWKKEIVANLQSVTDLDPKLAAWDRTEWAKICERAQTDRILPSVREFADDLRDNLARDLYAHIARELYGKDAPIARMKLDKAHNFILRNQNYSAIAALRELQRMIDAARAKRSLG